jgi:hypothetical protein
MKKKMCVSFLLFCVAISVAPVASAQASLVKDTRVYGKYETFGINDGIIEGDVKTVGIGARKVSEEYVSGGHWVRGIADYVWPFAQIISRYKNYSIQGHASVEDGNRLYDSGGWQPAGTYSSAQLDATWWGNKAYYNSKK